MNRLDQKEEHNKRLMKKEDKLNFFLQAYPQYKPLSMIMMMKRKRIPLMKSVGKKATKMTGNKKIILWLLYKKKYVCYKIMSIKYLIIIKK